MRLRLFNITMSSNPIPFIRIEIPMVDNVTFVSCGFGMVNSDEHLPPKLGNDDFSIQSNLMSDRNATVEQLLGVIPGSEFEKVDNFMSNSVSINGENFGMNLDSAPFMDPSSLIQNCASELQLKESPPDVVATSSLTDEASGKWSKFDNQNNQKMDYTAPADANAYIDPWN